MIMLCVSQIVAGKIKQIGVTLLGGHTWELVPGFSWTLPHGPFPSADFNWYSSAVINCNHEEKSFSDSCEAF